MRRKPIRSLLTLDPRAVLLGIVLTVSVLGGLSWCAVTALDYIDTIGRAVQDTRATAQLLEGHARSMLEPHVALLDRVADRLQGRGMGALADRALDEALSAPPGTLAIVDADGSGAFGPTILFDGPPDGALDRVDDGSGLLAGAGSVDGVPALVLGRRVRGPDGGRDGAVLVALPASALSAVLNALDGPQRHAGLYRPDGGLIAGSGVVALGGLHAVDDDETQVADSWPAAGHDNVLAWRRVGRLPVMAAVAVPRDAVLAPWRSRLERGVLVTGTSLLALLGLAGLGWGSLRREEMAMKALAEANARLEQRVEERTSDLRALNQKLVAALAEKERAHQAKARFLSAANHDLRQPFQALRLFHHLLNERLKDPRDKAIADKMGDALDSGEKLLHALLEVATLDAGVVRPNIGAVSIDGVLEEVVAEFRPAAAAKGLELRVHACGCTVRSDPVLLTRMLHDLVGNAVAYTGEGGILIGCRRRGQWLRIEVWDTGAGIAAEHLDSIFEDFVQLGNPERDRSQGLGLGLAKVRRKAALLGHAVEVRSRPGRGSVFAVMVPVAAPEAVAEAAPAPTGPETAAPAERLILVVEDDPVQRSGVQLLLEGWGHRVITAADGFSALERVRGAPRAPDVVVTDFRLPGPMTGVQVVTRVGEAVGHPVPGIILTGDTAPERIREAVATGCRLLHKPFSPELLRDALAAVEPAPAARGAQRAATAA
ncbi:hybrid sensor histidine kinase/response regulator [Azospirillum sp.]|uniref:hybrid sensor histidine kinase/response regulator n=1 Tax=Azospirillum sp. TaxID=34012 RepID=UPI003D73E115